MRTRSKQVAFPIKRIDDWGSRLPWLKKTGSPHVIVQISISIYQANLDQVVINNQTRSKDLKFLDEQYRKSLPTKLGYECMLIYFVDVIQNWVNHWLDNHPNMNKTEPRLRAKTTKPDPSAWLYPWGIKIGDPALPWLKTTGSPQH